MPHFQTLNTADLESHLKLRPQEIKLGQKIVAADFDRPDIKYVLIGLPEDIGVRANYGLGGTQTAWPAFLSAFLNIQSTELLPGNNICLYGQLDTTDLSIDPKETDIELLREAVGQIDEAVDALIYEITAAGKIPIVIGGGHNNAYPIIKGTAKGHYAKKRISKASINTINLDAHADYRALEGRHSGNGFRYAMEERYLARYAVIGLHRNYNSQAMLKDMEHNADIDFTFWEDIFLRNALSFKDAVQRALNFTSDQLCGIELDLDGMENTLSSAATPSGITTTQARQYLHQIAGTAQVAYVHICEGAAALSDGRQAPLLGKLISYLISDFIRAHRERNDI
jgi:formiminoglutamase